MVKKRTLLSQIQAAREESKLLEEISFVRHTIIQRMTQKITAMFEEFNQQISSENSFIGHADDEILLLDLHDASQIAQKIMDLYDNPNPNAAIFLKKQAPHFLQNPGDEGVENYLTNAAIIYKDETHISVLIKSRTRYRDSRGRQHTFHGATRIVKPYAFFFKYSLLERKFTEVRREVTFSRIYDDNLHKHNPQFKITRAQKSRDLKEKMKIVDSYALSEDAIGYEILEFKNHMNIETLIMHAPYAGIPMELTWSKHFTPLQKGSMIFSYLQSLINIIKNGFWPSDFKVKNTCVLVDGDNIRLNIIDYTNEGGPTYSIFKAIDASRPLIDLFAFQNILADLRPKIETKIFEIRHGNSSTQNKIFFYAKMQMIIELLHMIFIISEWPRVHHIQDLVFNNPLPSNIGLMKVWFRLVSAHNKKVFYSPVELLRLQATKKHASPFIHLLLKKLEPLHHLTELSARLHYFQKFLNEIRIIHSANVVWPEDFTEEWITENGQLIDRFFAKPSTVPVKRLEMSFA